MARAASNRKEEQPKAVAALQEPREGRNGCATIRDAWDITSGTL